MFVLDIFNNIVNLNAIVFIKIKEFEILAYENGDNYSYTIYQGDDAEKIYEELKLKLNVTKL